MLRAEIHSPLVIQLHGIVSRFLSLQNLVVNWQHPIYNGQISSFINDILYTSILDSAIENDVIRRPLHHLILLHLKGALLLHLSSA